MNYVFEHPVFSIIVLLIVCGALDSIIGNILNRRR